MKIQSFTFNPLQECTYVVWDSAGNGVLIDSGNHCESENLKLKHFVEEHQIQIRHILCTHLHFDHIFGADWASRTFDADVMGNEADRFWLEHMGRYASALGIEGCDRAPVLSRNLCDGSQVDCGEIHIEVLGVPGHSQGGLAFYLPSEGWVFSGDSLFSGSIGRTDLQGGDYATLIESIGKRLLCLPPETRVFPGHGPATTIGFEKEGNFYL